MDFHGGRSATGDHTGAGNTSKGPLNPLALRGGAIVFRTFGSVFPTSPALCGVGATVKNPGAAGNPRLSLSTPSALQASGASFYGDGSCS